MRLKTLDIRLVEKDLPRELSGEERKLVQEAMSALPRSYSPYSDFKVGASVLLENGEIITGTNQENAVFPLGLCAERVALFAASHQYPDIPVKALAVTTEKKDKTAFPCGSCRQVISEYEQKFDQPIRLFIIGPGEVFVIPSVEAILPYTFGKKDLQG